MENISSGSVKSVSTLGLSDCIFSVFSTVGSHWDHMSDFLDNNLDFLVNIFSVFLTVGFHWDNNLAKSGNNLDFSVLAVVAQQ